MAAVNFNRHGGGRSGEAGAAPGEREPARALETAGAEAPRPPIRAQRVDDNQLSGFGRLAADPRLFTSRHDNDYVVLRIAQNVRLVGREVITNWLDLICFGGAAARARHLVRGQEVYFRGTFAQVADPGRGGQPPRVTAKVLVEYLYPGRKPKPAEGAADGG
jgi:hypothetical protein